MAQPSKVFRWGLTKMPEFQTYTCENCGDEFKALDGANAAENGYCSPACETAGS